MITAREVAEKVGISISTVGRALTDDPRISAETKAKVRRVA
jgi:DNA-binding LacI/PurR family transcriptional regulator